jgi:hypothetical protein
VASGDGDGAIDWQPTTMIGSRIAPTNAAVVAITGRRGDMSADATRRLVAGREPAARVGVS